MQRKTIHAEEHHPYYSRYLEKVPPDLTLVEAYKTGRDRVMKLLFGDSGRAAQFALRGRQVEHKRGLSTSD